MNYELKNYRLFESVNCSKYDSLVTSVTATDGHLVDFPSSSSALGVLGVLVLVLVLVLVSFLLVHPFIFNNDLAPHRMW